MIRLYDTTVFILLKTPDGWAPLTVLEELLTFDDQTLG